MENRMAVAETKAWDYEVALKEIQTADSPNCHVRTRLATVDNTNSVLGLVSPSYQLIQNKSVYEIMEEIGKDLDLNLQSITVVKNKRATMFRYGFGSKHDRTVKFSQEPNDIVRFGIEIFNSFDSALGGSCFRAFAQRLACLNGMTVPSTISKVSFSSFKNLNFDTVKAGLQDRIPPILETASIWDKWAQMEPNRTKVGEFVCSNFTSKTTREELLKNFDNAKDKTLWGLYNILTYHITHNVKTEDPANLRVRQWELERAATKMYTTELV